jgi:4-hydroxy-4-methyl-2-oxoglutarate aldolase
MNSRPLTMQSTYKEICERLSKITTASICNAYKEIRLMDTEIASIKKNDRCVGRAYTVNSAQDSLSTMQTLSDLQAFLAFLDCKDDIVPTILMIASCGATKALAGGICINAAKSGGFGGVIIDGPCRDIQEIEACELPFFAKGKCAKSGTKDKVGSIKKTINCGGVEISPGDIILADVDGIVVMNKEEAIAAIPQAEEVQQTDALFLQKIKEGVPFNKLCNIDEHVNNINEGIPSKLKVKM